MKVIARRGNQELIDLENGRGFIREDGIDYPPGNVVSILSRGYWDMITPVAASLEFGDVDGHPFRGNQWTKNRGETSDAVDLAATNLKKYEDDFHLIGGKTSRVSGADAERLIDDVDLLQEVLDVPVDDSRDATGFAFTQFALSDAIETDGEGPDFTVVATNDDGDVAGAISCMQIDNEMLNPEDLEEGVSFEPAVVISYLGSTGVLEGTGCALVADVVRYAAERNLAVMGGPEKDALGFWVDKLGWREDPNEEGTDYYGWTAAEVKQIAKKL